MTKKIGVFLCLYAVCAYFALPSVCPAEEKGALVKAWEKISSKDKKTVSEKKNTQKPAAAKSSVKTSVDQTKAGSEKPTAKKEKTDASKKEDAGKKKKRPIPEDLTNEEMIKVINMRVETFGEIAYMIPGFSKRTGPDDKISYYYAADGGIASPIEDLDRETLYALFVMINNEATRLQTERLMKQIEQQSRLVQQIQSQQKQLQAANNQTSNTMGQQQQISNIIQQQAMAQQQRNLQSQTQTGGQVPRVYQPPTPPPAQPKTNNK
ncbi:MAG TPA: hypothetical protein PKY78_02575 [Candidatus Omnitrophota bacterium]|nr:hypothetical protein [Candidatus Omnitrophota bacterium]